MMLLVTVTVNATDLFLYATCADWTVIAWLYSPLQLRQKDDT